jgi:hypothetical protein
MMEAVRTYDEESINQTTTSNNAGMRMQVPTRLLVWVLMAG